jgi:hypothetical protein
MFPVKASRFAAIFILLVAHSGLSGRKPASDPDCGHLVNLDG